MADLNTFRENLHSLVSKFEQDKNHYLQKGSPEARIRIDFTNPFEKSIPDRLVSIVDGCSVQVFTERLYLYKRRREIKGFK